MLTFNRHFDCICRTLNLTTIQKESKLYFLKTGYNAAVHILIEYAEHLIQQRE